MKTSFEADITVTLHFFILKIEKLWKWVSKQIPAARAINKLNDDN